MARSSQTKAAKPRPKRRRLPRNTPPPEPPSVVEMVQRLRAGEADAKALSADDRRRCVQYLGVEGLSVPEIAQLMGCSDRTIARDRAQIQDDAALEPDPAFRGRFAGRLAAEAEACLARIRRVTRDREAPPAVKIEGEKACFEILCGLGEQLQRLGLLPHFGGQMQVDLHNHGEAVPSFEEIEAEMKRLENAAAGSDPAPGTLGRLTELNTLMQRAKLAQGVKQVASQPPPPEE